MDTKRTIGLVLVVVVLCVMIGGGVGMALDIGRGLGFAWGGIVGCASGLILLFVLVWRLWHPLEPQEIISLEGLRPYLGKVVKAMSPGLSDDWCFGLLGTSFERFRPDLSGPVVFRVPFEIHLEHEDGCVTRLDHCYLQQKNLRVKTVRPEEYAHIKALRDQDPSG